MQPNPPSDVTKLKLFPGQVPRIDFDIEQLRSLGSPVRSEVFWTFGSEEPQSVAEIARAIGKSAQTVHYHVNELVRVGLLLAVEERKQHARTEKLYVHRAVANFSIASQGDNEYRAEVVRGFAALARTLSKQYAAAHQVMNHDGTVADFIAYRQTQVRVSAEMAARLKKRLFDVEDEAGLYDVGADGTLVNVAVFMAPTVAESREWLKRAGGNLEEEEDKGQDSS